MLHFEDDDAGYAAWLREHPAGYVLTNPVDTDAFRTLHSAGCRSIAGRPNRGVTRTSNGLVKVCALSVADLDRLAEARTGRPARRCQYCAE